MGGYRLSTLTIEDSPGECRWDESGEGARGRDIGQKGGRRRKVHVGG